MKSTRRTPLPAPRTSRGFAWQTSPGYRPAVRSVSHGQGAFSAFMSRLQHTMWVIDYCFHDGEEYRAVHERAPWLPRRANTAHLYAPYTLYWERVTRGPVPRHSASLLFTDLPAGPAERLVGTTGGFAEFEDPDGEYGKIMAAAADAGHRLGEEGLARVQGYLFDLIDRMLRASRVDGPVWRLGGARPAVLSLATRVDDYLRNAPSARVSVAQIARAVNVSPSTLSHTYKRLTGRSVMTAAMELRVRLAKPLLLEGRRLKEIADRLGFADAFHLSKQFKRVTGQSPRAFMAGARSEGWMDASARRDDAPTDKDGVPTDEDGAPT